MHFTKKTPRIMERYECDNCYKSFGMKSNLNHHIKDIHENKNEEKSDAKRNQVPKGKMRYWKMWQEICTKTKPEISYGRSPWKQKY